MLTALAIDLGAGSGRAVLGRFDGQRLVMEEIHRFTNEPVWLGPFMYWDMPRFMAEIETSMKKAAQAGGFESLGVDAWGVDFGFLDSRGELLGGVRSYQDPRLSGMLDKAYNIMSAEDIYRASGVQLMEINTLFQLLWAKDHDPETLERARTLLMLPNLINYFLTGEKCAEATIASTSQMMNPATSDWNRDLIQRFKLPLEILPHIAKTGSVVGPLTEGVSARVGTKAYVINVCGHDTASAVLAVPAATDDFAYISSGTWSLLGTELKSPIINDASAAYNFSNEIGWNGSIRLLKNIEGLWRLKTVRREAASNGRDIGFAEAEAMAENPKDETSKRIREVYDSLALNYKQEFAKLKALTGKDYDTIHVVGGGSKDKLLSRLTAEACGVKVVCGPAEATAMGNILAQLMALGHVRDFKEARELAARSPDIKIYD